MCVPARVRACVSVCNDSAASGSIYQGLAPSRLVRIGVDEVYMRRSSAAANSEPKRKQTDLLLLTSHTECCKNPVLLLCV